MNVEQMRARVGEILAKIEELNGIENLDKASLDQINALSSEFETLKAQIEAKEKLATMSASANAPVRKTASEPVARVEVQASRQEKLGGFKSVGEFLSAVKGEATGKKDKRFENTLFERNGEDGGFLVPEEMMTTITKKLATEESLLSKTTQFAVSGNSLTFPTDESQPWNSGVEAYWLAEGAAYTSSKGKVGMASLKLNKLGALIKISDELAEDSVALESFMLAKAPEAIMHKINSAIISGNGVGKPMGILNSGFKITAAKESGQAADTIVAKNVIKMYSKMIPSARAGAAWYVNAGCEEQLRTMKDDLGNFIYLAPGSQLNQSPYGQLLGLPVIPMIGSLPQLGDEGDIALVNFSYYYTILKSSGMKQSISSHLYFDRDVQAYKFTMRIDGNCPFKSPVETEFGGHQMSAIVTLEAR